MLSRIAYLVYWLSDNLYLLNNFKLVSFGDNYKINRITFLFRFIGLILNILKNLIAMTKSKNLTPEILTIIGDIFDLLPTIQGMDIMYTFYKKQMNDGLAGLGGFVSAIVEIFLVFYKFDSGNEEKDDFQIIEADNSSSND